MSLTELEVHGYRSLRNLRLELGPLNVITGGNGTGKSNLYRALWLIAQIAEGQFAQSICREGGFLSVMWAGARTNHRQPVRMTLAFRTEEFGYQMSCGFPVPSESRFSYDPQIKEETVWFGPRILPSTTLLARKGGITHLRDTDGNRIDYPLTLDDNESVLGQLREPQRYPELFTLREEIRAWRFYHQFRTDEAAPLRTPRVSVRTTVLSHDGADLAAALETINEIGDRERLEHTITKALPGRQLCILSNDCGPHNKSPKFAELAVGLQAIGCARVLEANELSDGTLKFLCLVACLLSPRPPRLIALNEPEASLHPDLLTSLAELIVHASRHSQVWVSTHSPTLVAAMEQQADIRPVRLGLQDGETMLEEE